MNPLLSLELLRIMRYALHLVFVVYILVVCGTAFIRENNRRLCWPRWRREKEKTALEFSPNMLPHERGCSSNPFGREDKDTWEGVRAHGSYIVRHKQLKHRSVRKRYS